MTAIPGITVEQATLLAKGPDGIEVDGLMNNVTELYGEVRAGSPNSARSNLLIERIGKTMERLKQSSIVARAVGTRLTEMNNADNLMMAADGMAQIVELTAGYRAKMIAAGFGEGAAEGMAAQFHTMLMMRASGAPTA